MWSAFAPLNHKRDLQETYLMLSSLICLRILSGETQENSRIPQIFLHIPYLTLAQIIPLDDRGGPRLARPTAPPWGSLTLGCILRQSEGNNLKSFAAPHYFRLKPRRLRRRRRHFIIRLGASSLMSGESQDGGACWSDCIKFFSMVKCVLDVIRPQAWIV